MQWTPEPTWDDIVLELVARYRGAALTNDQRAASNWLRYAARRKLKVTAAEIRALAAPKEKEGQDVYK